jgi:hypothetical protein
MPRATGRRIAAAACFLVGGLSVVGIPILWPIGYLIYKSAKSAEDERERELDALERLAEKD